VVEKNVCEAVSYLYMTTALSTALSLFLAYTYQSNVIAIETNADILKKTKEGHGHTNWM